jgi:hypothetical protein
MKPSSRSRSLFEHDLFENRCPVFRIMRERSAECEVCHTRSRAFALCPSQFFLFFEGGTNVDAAEGFLVVLVRELGTVSFDLPDGPARPAFMTALNEIMTR